MTDTTDAVAGARRGRSGLAAMNVAELKGMASSLGITGTTKMRKDDLVSAISARQGGAASAAAEDERSRVVSAKTLGPAPEIVAA